MGNTSSTAARHKGACFACEADVERPGVDLPCPRRRTTHSCAHPCDGWHTATPLTRGGVAPHLRAPQRLVYLASGPSRALAKTTYNCCLDVASFKRMINPNNSITAEGSAMYG